MKVEKEKEYINERGEGRREGDPVAPRNLEVMVQEDQCGERKK